MNKQSKQPISKIQRLLWAECKRIIRKIYPNSCYTCRARGLEGSNLQSGHVWATASLGAFLKYDLHVLRPQCFRCNIHLGGMGAEFYRRMLKEEGKPFMNRLERDRKVTVKAYDHYVELLELYKTM